MDLKDQFDGSNGNGSQAVANATPEPFADWTPRRVITATLIVLAIAAAFLLVFRFYMVVFLFLVAVMLGTATKPFVGWLERRGIRPAIGLILVYLALLAALALFLLLIVPMLAGQVSSVIDKLPEHYSALRQGLIESNNRFIQRLALGLPLTVTFSLSSITTPPAGDSTGLAAIGPALSALGGVTKTVFVIMVILILAYYWVQEGEVLVRRVIFLLPPERREPARGLYAELEGAVSGYFRGQAILCLAVGLLVLIGYLIIGLPYAVGLALIMVVCEAIPMIGPLLGAIPAMLVALTLAPDKILLTAVVIFVAQMSENHLLVPRIMDRSVGVNPIITILGIAAFGALFGFAGALLAVPLSAAVQIIASRAMFREPASAADEVGRGRAGILRLAAQELMQDVRKSSRTEPEEGVLVDPDVERAEDLLEAIAVDLDKMLTDQETEVSQ
ncbi:MAG: AI-2E family transporter [Nitrososphaerales archaeon]